MGIGPTLLGGIVGSAVGVGLHALLETGMLGKPIEAAWFAIVIGLLTGIGVRQANRQHLERSYLRGGVSAIIALTAICASTYLIAEIMKKRDVTAGSRVATASTAATAKETDDDQPAESSSAEAPPVNPPDRIEDAALAGPGGASGRGGDFNPWQFVFMALGALVAYEFGRGASTTPIDPAESPPQGFEKAISPATDPSE